MNKFYKAFSVLGIVTPMSVLSPLMAQTPFMVKDIATGGTSSGLNQCRQIANLGGVAFFAAAGGASGALGKELWKSDGTEAGTVMVKELVSGSGNGMYDTQGIGVMGKNIYFAGGKDGLLYRSNGTDAGTVTIPGSVTYTSPHNFTEVNGTMFFYAAGIGGDELWKTDGATATFVKDIRTGNLSSSSTEPMINYNGTLFFLALDATNGAELWKSDGTEAGTVMVKNIHPTGSSNPQNFVIANNILFFTADNGTQGRELWKTDGTDAGTVMIKDIYANGSAASIDYTIINYPYKMVALNNKIYFSAQSTPNIGHELWESDGTEAGTKMTKEINPGTVSSAISNLTNINGTLYFQATSGGPYQAWKSDGTAAGTMAVTDGTNGINTPSFFTGYNNDVYFYAFKSGLGQEIYKTNGTPAGTSLVTDLKPGTGSGAYSNPEGTRIMEQIGDKLFFVGDDGVNGIELWAIGTGVVTGTAAATEQSKELRLYPNPATDKIIVESSLGQGAVQIVDMQGNMLQTLPMQNENITLDIQELPAGIYLLRINSADKTSSKTFIKK